MATNVQPTSQSYWAQTTNFWNNKDNGTVMKVIKFVGALFMYPFALLGDIATKASQLVFGKKEEAPASKLKWHQRFTNFVTSTGKSTWDTTVTHKWKFIGGATALTAGLIAYRYGLFGSALGAYRNNVPTLLGGYRATATSTTATATSTTAAATNATKV